MARPGGVGRPRQHPRGLRDVRLGPSSFTLHLPAVANPRRPRELRDTLAPGLLWPTRLAPAVRFPPPDTAALRLLPVPGVPHRLTLAVREGDGGLAYLTALDNPAGVAQALPRRDFWQYFLPARTLE